MWGALKYGLFGFFMYRLGKGSAQLPIRVVDTLNFDALVADASTMTDPTAPEALDVASKLMLFETFAAAFGERPASLVLLHVKSVTGDEGCFLAEGAEGVMDVPGYLRDIATRQLAVVQTTQCFQSFDALITAALSGEPVFAGVPTVEEDVDVVPDALEDGPATEMSAYMRPSPQFRGASRLAQRAAAQQFSGRTYYPQYRENGRYVYHR